MGRLKLPDNWRDWSKSGISKCVRVADLFGLPFGMSFGEYGISVSRLTSKPNGSWQTRIIFNDRSHPTIRTAGRSLSGEIDKVERFVELYRAGLPTCRTGCHRALVMFNRKTGLWKYDGWGNSDDHVSRWGKDSYCLASDERLLVNGNVVQMAAAASLLQRMPPDHHPVVLPEEMKLREWDE